MKTTVICAIVTAGLALSISPAFAISNSSDGRVVVTSEAVATTDTRASEQQAMPRHFLSGDEQADPDFGLSSNAIQGRDFLNAQKGRR